MTTNTIKPALAESAARIQQAMTEKGMRLKDVAQALDMPDNGSSVHNWSTGRNAPSPRYRAQLAELLDLKVEDLMPPDWDQQQGGQWMRMPSEDGHERKRQADRAYQKRRRRQAKANGHAPGPAETALLTFKQQDPPKPPAASDVLSSALRSDGTMRIKLDVSLPTEAGYKLLMAIFANMPGEHTDV